MSKFTVGGATVEKLAPIASFSTVAPTAEYKKVANFLFLK